MLDEINRNDKKHIMWYPSSGDDFRPIHNCNFNNFFIEIKTYFFNDISSAINIESLEKIDEITLESQTSDDVSVGKENFQYQKMIFTVNFPNRKAEKTVYYFPNTTNQEMLKLIQEIKCVSVLLFHRCCSFSESKSWVEKAKELKVKYLFTDNLFAENQNQENNIIKELIREYNLQLISKSSYFRKKYENIKKNIESNSQELFDSFIYCFKL